MTLYYDAELGNKLGSNNPESGVVLNKYFKDWKEHIDENIGFGAKRSNSEDPDIRYEKEMDKSLFYSAMNHAFEHENNADMLNVIMLVHPFYLQLNHMNKVQSLKAMLEVENYNDNLMHLLNRNATEKKASVVLLETLHHYAAASSLLVENGLVDKVIFTEYAKGIPLDRSELMEFSEREIYFAGGYNKLCLSTSIRIMKFLHYSAVPEKHLWAIEDLVVAFPESDSIIKKEEIEEIQPKNVLSLEEALIKLGFN